MANLPKYTLLHDGKKDDWVLKEDRSARVRYRFKNKTDATRGGALRKALGQVGGSVKIQKLDGTIQEERTYPKSKDPKRSPG
jgi:hypothetical protein